MLGLERERLREVVLQLGGGLARDAVEEIERDVVESGITKSVHGAPDVVGAGPALEHLEQMWLEALGPERDTRDAGRAKEAGQILRHRLRVRLDRHLGGSRERREDAASSGAGAVNVGVPPPTKTVSSARPEHRTLAGRARPASASAHRRACSLGPARPLVTKSQ